MTNENARQLVERAVAGDREATEILFEEKGKRILYTAISMMGNRHDGEEVAQEVMIRLYRNIGKLRNPEFFDTWMFRVIVNECNTQRKRRMTRDKDIQITEKALDGIPEERVEFLPPEFAENSEKRRLLLNVVQNLRPNYKMATLLHYYDGLSCPQVAEAMGISTQMVKNYLMRARKKIREELEKAADTKFENVFAAAPIPVLTYALECNADEVVVPRQVKYCMKRAGEKAGRAANPGARSALAKATAGVAAVAVALSAAAASAGVLPAWHAISPLSSSVAGAAVAPQPTGEGPAAEDGLEINESISPMAGQDPQSGPAEGGEVVAMGITGAVVLEDVKNDPVAGAQTYLENITVELLDAAGVTVGKTVTDGSGNFAFQDTPVEMGGVLRVGIKGTALLPSEKNPHGAYPVGAKDAGGVVTIYVKKAGVSKTEIVFVGGGCDCGHMNPKTAKAVCADELDTPQNWEIENESGSVVARGQGAVIQAELETLPEGTYTICFEIRDIAGNAAEAKRVFCILDGPVDRDMYQ